MLAESHTGTYFDRMESSLGDKKNLLKYIRPGRILDVGAGGGDLAEAMRLLGNDVTALDGSSKAIERIKENYPHLNTIEADTADLEYIYEPETFDTIVCSSILHEVYSYSIDRHNKGFEMTNMDVINETLETFYNLLKPGGKLLIRDGVKPDNWENMAMVKFVNEESKKDAKKFLAFFMNNSPFEYSEKVDENNFLHFSTGKDYIKGNLQSIMEFLYTYTWGWESAEREVLELYGIMTEGEYCSTLREKGFEIETSYQYLQPGYKEHLDPFVELVSEYGHEIDYPSSNMIIVAGKA